MDKFVFTINNFGWPKKRRWFFKKLYPFAQLKGRITVEVWSCPYREFVTIVPESDWYKGHPRPNTPIVLRAETWEALNPCAVGQVVVTTFKTAEPVPVEQAA